jgi:hypothetical protein
MFELGLILEQAAIIYVGKYLQGDVFGPTTSTGIWAYAEYFSWGVAVLIPMVAQGYHVEKTLINGVVGWLVATIFGRAYGYIG